MAKETEAKLKEIADKYNNKIIEIHSIQELSE